VIRLITLGEGAGRWESEDPHRQRQRHRRSSWRARTSSRMFRLGPRRSLSTPRPGNLWPAEFATARRS